MALLEKKGFLAVLYVEPSSDRTIVGFFLFSRTLKWFFLTFVEHFSGLKWFFLTFAEPFLVLYRTIRVLHTGQL